MQIEKSDYREDLHEVHKAISVRQPFADQLTRPVYQDTKGGWHASKRIAIMSRRSNYRGDLVVCSSALPEVEGHLSAVTCGLVRLVEVRHVSTLTAEEWESACYRQDKRPRNGYAWIFEDPRRLVEMPVKGNVGVYDLIVPKGDLTEYPREMAVGSEWDNLLRRKK